VFVNEKRLQQGRRFQDDLIKSIVNSTIVVPIFSVDALAKMVIHDPMVVDNLLLEWICALEGNKSDYSRINYICPLYIGKRDSMSGKLESVFNGEILKQISDIVPLETLKFAESLLIRNKVFTKAPTGFLSKTVKSIVTDISRFVGVSVDDDRQKNFLTRCADNLMKILDNHFTQLPLVVADAAAADDALLAAAADDDVPAPLPTSLYLNYL